ncbi:MAG: 50S ribosomal protein L25/general stress protein Ctc [Pseudomonadota bacterium]|nr:50S ribosomal protein L25/general stress protein Ctc [Pseudomonadota bacterium]
MSVETFEVTAELRQDQGKGASRRLRRAGKVPAIVYGGHGEPVPVTLEYRELKQHLEHEAFYSHVLQLKLDGASEQVILKDLQRHPYREMIWHVDFQRVVAGEALHVQVPLHFVGEEKAEGVRRGGIVSRQITEVEVRCLPRDIPEFIEVDISGLDIGDSLHLSDLRVPEGITLVNLAEDSEHDRTVVAIVPPRLPEAEAPEAEGEPGAGEAAP